MVKRRLPYLCRYSFFGLTQEYRFNLFKTIHEIVYFGHGGYDYLTVYNMPIWLRNITFKFIQDSINQENNKNNQKPGNTTKTTLDWVNPDRSKL